MFAHFMWFFSDTAVDAAACPSKNCQKWNMSGIHFFSVSFQLNTIQQCQTEIIYDAIVLFYTMFAVWCQHENTSIMLFDFYLSFDLLLLFFAVRIDPIGCSRSDFIPRYWAQDNMQWWW